MDSYNVNTELTQYVTDFLCNTKQQWCALIVVTSAKKTVTHEYIWSTAIFDVRYISDLHHLHTAKYLKSAIFIGADYMQVY